MRSVAPNCTASCGLVGQHVDRDDPLGTGEFRALHDVEADPAAADHRHRRAGLDGRGVDHCADAGGDGTADDGDRVQRCVVAHLHRTRGRHHHLFGERRDAEVVMQRLAVLGQREVPSKRTPLGATSVATFWQRASCPERQ